MVIYILSISFQVAGALLLMVNALSTRRDRVIHRFASHSLIYRDNNTGELEYDKEALKGAFKEAYLSKFAFAEIAIGYFLGVFGALNDSANRWLIAIGIIITTTILIYISRLLVRLILTYNKNITRSITNDELSVLGIEPAMENISDMEIDELFK